MQNRSTVCDLKNEMEIIMELWNGCFDFYEISHGDSRIVGELKFRAWTIQSYRGRVHRVPKLDTSGIKFIKNDPDSLYLNRFQRFYMGGFCQSRSTKNIIVTLSYTYIISFSLRDIQLQRLKFLLFSLSNFNPIFLKFFLFH